MAIPTHFVYNLGSVLILATVLCVYIAGAGKFRPQDTNRTCIPAEAEPSLNSSSCYPLVNFTRPFCQNLGIRLENYVFRTPRYQNWKNNEGNKDYYGVDSVDDSKISRYFKVNISTVRKCKIDFPIIFCRQYFPRCDRTQSSFKEQKVCRESCLKLHGMCGKLFRFFRTYFLIRFPTKGKFYDCELQPHRNAGESPECWYYNEFANITDNSDSPNWTRNADCLYLNGSSYHGNISVTASGIPCQSWIEQCPHRHTMNTTYPELNHAKNYCRNPQNSGRLPWCFTTDRSKRWEYCDIPKCIPVDGNYSNWSLSIKCNVSCGQGFETWTRNCNNPEPMFGGQNCSHLGEAVLYRPCFERNCPVNGGYGNWTLTVPCNVSCGGGIEIWRRSCDNPEAKYGGRNCSERGSSTEFRHCSRKPCPVEGNYGNWTKSSPCSVTCGQGVEIWTRQCDNPPGKFSGNCSKQGEAQEVRPCEMDPCPVLFNAETIGVAAGTAVFVLVVAVIAFRSCLQRRRRKQASLPYAVLNFSPQHFQSSPEPKSASSSDETGTSAEYQNLTSNNNPVPGLSRGVVPYRKDYINARPSRSLWYDKLQLIRPVAIEWLRNTWGSVDEFGRHVYDIMHRHVRHIFLPYDRLVNLRQADSAGSGRGSSSETYDTLDRFNTVLLPNEDENIPKAESQGSQGF